MTSPAPSALNQAIATQLDQQFPGHGYGGSFLAWCAKNPGPATSVSALAMWAQDEHVKLTHGQLDSVFKGASETGHGASSLIPGGTAGPFSWVGVLSHWAGQFVLHLTDAHMWISLGWMVLGIALMIFGVYLLIRLSETYKQAESAIVSTAGKL